MENTINAVDKEIIIQQLNSKKKYFIHSFDKSQKLNNHIEVFLRNDATQQDIFSSYFRSKLYYYSVQCKDLRNDQKGLFQELLKNEEKFEAFFQQFLIDLSQKGNSFTFFNPLFMIFLIQK